MLLKLQCTLHHLGIVLKLRFQFTRNRVEPLILRVNKHPMNTDATGAQIILLSNKEEKIAVCSVNHTEKGQESRGRAGMAKDPEAHPEGVLTADPENEP